MGKPSVPTDELRWKVDGAVADLCQEVAEEPLCFFSEADLQAMMYMRLRQIFPRSVPLREARGPGAKTRFTTSQVHREYGAGERRRLDLAVLAAAQFALADRFYKDGADYLVPAFGFEFGTEKIGDATSEHIRSDVGKLQRCDRGYLVHIFRDMAVADEGTDLRAAAEQRIDRIFRRVAGAITPPNNVRAVLLVVGVTHSRKNLRGRCQLLDPRTGEWQRINARHVGRRVLKLLSA